MAMSSTEGSTFRLSIENICYTRAPVSTVHSTICIHSGGAVSGGLLCFAPILAGRCRAMLSQMIFRIGYDGYRKIVEQSRPSKSNGDIGPRECIMGDRV